jgi:ankyrin repeat protein
MIFYSPGSRFLLSNAVDENNPEAVELLIQQGADINYKTEAGWSLIAWAKEHKYEEVTAILRKYGAKE